MHQPRDIRHPMNHLCLATDSCPWLADSGSMERGDDDASWPIPQEVPVQVRGVHGFALGKKDQDFPDLQDFYKVYQMNSTALK